MLTERDKHNHKMSFFVQILAGTFLVIFVGLLMKFKSKIDKKAEKKLINEKVKTILKGKFKMSNQKFIEQLNEAVKQNFIDFISEVEKMGFAVAITSGYRSFSEQIILKKKDSRNASAGFSSHNYGTALDMVLYKDGKMIGKGKQFTQEWLNSGVPQLAKSKYKMRWGGDFPGYPDEVHFDYNNKYDTKKLYELAIKEFGSAENAKGNELKLV